ncbi:hypothetical protein GO986_20535 [Deinococcus sp. HMF7620]|uniref:Uncharacterized protein n=1 Tax=Deinococcus arboris TaxID=2682977 RepID=A0A7C9I1I9_9DEIO|nr:hypothetical protein [Deinococcus arboris]MVN89130.1 hypothetical protein [Deinococcus arboris]
MPELKGGQSWNDDGLMVTTETWDWDAPRDDVRPAPLLPLRVAERRTLRALLRRHAAEYLDETVAALDASLTEGSLDPYDREAFLVMARDHLKTLASRSRPLPAGRAQLFGRLKPQPSLCWVFRA